MAKWFFIVDGREFGPLQSAELKHLAGSGRLTPTDKVRREGDSEWYSAGNVRGLFSPIQAVQPPNLRVRIDGAQCNSVTGTPLNTSGATGRLFKIAIACLAIAGVVIFGSIGTIIVKGNRNSPPISATKLIQSDGSAVPQLAIEKLADTKGASEDKLAAASTIDSPTESAEAKATNKPREDEELSDEEVMRLAAAHGVEVTPGMIWGIKIDLKRLKTERPFITEDRYFEALKEDTKRWHQEQALGQRIRAEEMRQSFLQNGR